MVRQADALDEPKEGWALAALFDLCNPQQWPTIPTKVLLKQGYPVYGANGQIGFYSQYNHERPTVLMTCRGATCGTLNICKPFSYVTGNAMCLDDLEDTVCDLRFLLYALKNRGLEDAISGSAQPQITRRNLEVVDFPLAPIEEQRRIVAALDEYIGSVKGICDRLTQVPAILKRFRQAVLAAACSGALTEDWRQDHADIESAVDLLRIIEMDARSRPARRSTETNQCEAEPFELPPTWAWASVSEVCSSVTDGDHQAPPKAPTGVPFLVISNINTGKLNMESTMFVPREYYDRISDDRKPRRGDVLYSVTGSFGIPAPVDTDTPFCFQRHIALLRPHSRVSSSYLFRVMASDLVYRQASSVATGIAQLTVPLSGLRSLRIPVPPTEEQGEIGRRVDRLFLLADGIERQVAAATSRCGKLTQAILAKAFRGELVPTEAELARREGREYEPASVLLERIKKERGQRLSNKDSKRKRK
jgi:type I restriction enzyme, S subunit